MMTSNDRVFNLLFFIVMAIIFGGLCWWSIRRKAKVKFILYGLTCLLSLSVIIFYNNLELIYYIWALKNNVHNDPVVGEGWVKYSADGRLSQIEDKLENIGLPAVPALLSLLQSDNESERDVAGGILIYMLGIDFDYYKEPQIRNQQIEQIKLWWYENKDYLYRTGPLRKYLIDQESKTAGIPTDEYRKTHPWPKEEPKNK